jgi:hypothetical protein
MKQPCGEGRIGCGRMFREDQLDWSAWPPVCRECAKLWVPNPDKHDGGRVSVDERTEIRRTRKWKVADDDGEPRNRHEKHAVGPVTRIG